MQSHGTTSLYELFGDLVILRNLTPFDTRLPGLADAWQEMGLPNARTPRKNEPQYATASVWFVRQARALVPGAVRVVVAAGFHPATRRSASE